MYVRLNKYILSFLVLLVMNSTAKAQNSTYIDSLLNIVSNTTDNKLRVDAYAQLAQIYVNSETKKSREYANRAAALSEKINYPHGKIISLNAMAALDNSLGKHADALIKLKDALHQAEAIEDMSAIAKSFYYVGDVYSSLKNNKKAIQNYEKAAEMFAKANDEESLINTFDRIGNRNMDIGGELKDTSYFFAAIKIYSKSFALARKTDNKKKIINTYVNLADAYNILGVTTKNQSYFFHSLDNSLHGLKLSRENKFLQSEAINDINIGDTYEKLEQPFKSIHFYEEALRLYTKAGDKTWVRNTNTFLGHAYFQLKNYDKAVECINKSIALAKEQGYAPYLRDNYQLLAQIYTSKKDFEKALEFNQLYANYKDSISNENSEINLVRLQNEFDFERKNQEIELLKKNTEIQEQKISNQNSLRNFLIAIIVLVFILLAIIYRRYREKNKIQVEILKAKEVAEHAKETQEQFLANTSHEIRTPMNGIIGMTNHLKDTALSEDQREYISAIHESANSLLVLINDLLDLSKINAGKMTFEKKAFRISDLFKNLVYTLQYRSTEKNIRLLSSIDEKIPSVLIGDPVRLNQILLNLTGNAIKFTEKGEVKIFAKLLKDDGKNQLILFSVQDTGIGIQESKLNTIFESFTQVNARTTRKYGGTGLGLTIAKQLIEQQGGTISVSSKVNEGSTFTFTLQFKKLPRNVKEQRELNMPASDFNQPNLYSMSVLVVDDNKVNQRVAALTLQKWNAKVDVADNAKMAFDKLYEKKFDLILMDVTMPEMDGFEATKFIRKKLSPSVSKTPIIAMTASALIGDREKCIEVGMNEYVSKPFNPEELYEKIVKIIPTNDRNNNSPIIDLTILKERSEGDKEYLREIMGSYIEEMPVYVNEMKEFLKMENQNAIGPQAHKMKSPAKLLGAFELNQQLEFIEKHIAENGLSDQMKKKVDQMNALCLETVESMKKELEKII